MWLEAYKKAIRYNDGGRSSSNDFPFLDIPKGTLLFRGHKLPDIEAGEDERLFVREFLGHPQGDVFYMSPIHQTFFYPYPHAPFGIKIMNDETHTVLPVRFNAITIYQTQRNLTIFDLITDPNWFRGGQINGFPQAAPIHRCSKESSYIFLNPTKEQKTQSDIAKKWDNCLNLEQANKETFHGWIAMTDYESLFTFDKGGKGGKGDKEVYGVATTMGTYLRKLKQTFGASSGKFDEVVAHMYKDGRKAMRGAAVACDGHAGFPEICLQSVYPALLKKEERITRAKTEEEVVNACQKIAPFLNFLPIACVTAEGVMEAFTGEFRLSSIGKNARRVQASDSIHATIDKNLSDYLERLMTQGVTIPRLGKGKICQDLRTGFYVFDLLKPGEESLRSKGDMPEQKYSDFLQPLDTASNKKAALEYLLQVRRYEKDSFMDGFETSEGVLMPRAMVLNRHREIRDLYALMGDVPVKDYEDLMLNPLDPSDREGRCLPPARVTTQRGRKETQKGGTKKIDRNRNRKTVKRRGGSHYSGINSGTNLKMHSYLGKTWSAMWSAVEK